MIVTVLAVHAEMRRLGFLVFGKNAYDMNVIALRRRPGRPNAFDDLLTVSYLEQHRWVFEAFPCTTDPGLYYLEHPMNVNGTAIVKSPFQNRRSHRIGFHHAGQSNQYEAMVQCGPVRIWRDADGDQELDYTGETTAYASGINIHRAGENSQLVGRYSAGCLVVQKRDHFDRFMRLMHMQEDHGLGDTVSLSVLDWPDGNFA